MGLFLLRWSDDGCWFKLYHLFGRMPSRMGLEFTFIYSTDIRYFKPLSTTLVSYTASTPGCAILLQTAYQASIGEMILNSGQPDDLILLICRPEHLSNDCGTQDS